MIENCTYSDKAYNDSTKNIPCMIDSIAQGQLYCLFMIVFSITNGH